MTAQTPELLTFNGEQYAMCTEPLSEFVAVGGKLPEFVWPDTACWRGYIGEWEIIEDRLYLVGLEGELTDGSKANIETVFPGYPDRVFAHWYSGTIRLPQGELLDYVHGDYLSTYESDLLLTFEKGVLVGTETRKNNPSSTDMGF